MMTMSAVVFFVSESVLAVSVEFMKRDFYYCIMITSVCTTEQQSSSLAILLLIQFDLLKNSSCVRAQMNWLDLNFFPIVFYKLRRQKLALPTSSTFFICYTFFQKSLFDFFRFLLFMFHFQPSRFIIIRWAVSLQFCVLIAAAATTAAGEILLKLKQKLYQVNWLL